MNDLSINLGEIKLKNPVITASGTFGNGREFSQIIDLNKLGAITTKAITLEPRQGNPYPRVCETPSGIINTIGLQNNGVDYFIKNDAPFLRKFETVIIANVAGKIVEEYVEVCRKLEEAGSVDILEINISCPNVKHGGMAFGTDADQASRLISAIKKEVGLPVFVKLTPNACDVKKIAKAVELAGADGLSMINTILAMAIDPYKLKSKISSDYGGLSGPAIKPIALRMVHEVASQTKLPVIGIGGISSALDAVEFLAAGATAVSIGTANMVNPNAALDIIEGLDDYLKKSNDFNSIKSLQEFIKGQVKKSQ
jgi:dihydroorotate dehydrogenase (NAD+) catalytic subunit